MNLTLHTVCVGTNTSEPQAAPPHSSGNSIRLKRRPASIQRLIQMHKSLVMDYQHKTWGQCQAHVVFGPGEHKAFSSVSLVLVVQKTSGTWYFLNCVNKEDEDLKNAMQLMNAPRDTNDPLHPGHLGSPAPPPGVSELQCVTQHLGTWFISSTRWYTHKYKRI